MASHTIAADTAQEAQRRMRRASLRVLVVTALIVLFELIGGCAALPDRRAAPGLAGAGRRAARSLAQAAAAAMPAAAPTNPACACCPMATRPWPPHRADRAAPSARSTCSTTRSPTTPPARSSCARCATPPRAACACACCSTTCTPPTSTSCSPPWRRTRNVEVRLFNPLPVRNGSPVARLRCRSPSFSSSQPAHAQQAVHRRRRMSPSPAGATSATSTSCAARGQLRRHGHAGHRRRAARAGRRCSSATGTASRRIRSARCRSRRRRALRRAATPRPPTEPAYAARDRLGHDADRRAAATRHAGTAFAPRAGAGRPAGQGAGAADADHARCGQRGVCRARSEVVIVSPYFVPGDAAWRCCARAERGATRQRADQFDGRHRRADGARRLLEVPPGDARHGREAPGAQRRG